VIIAPDPAQVSEATPILAEIVAEMSDRPFYFQGAPFAVKSDRYLKAEAEMRAVLKLRGWNAPAIDADAPQPNFLLMGTPIVMEQ
jgi:hypothetical protein